MSVQKRFMPIEATPEALERKFGKAGSLEIQNWIANQASQFKEDGAYLVEIIYKPGKKKFILVCIVELKEGVATIDHSWISRDLFGMKNLRNWVQLKSIKAKERQNGKILQIKKK